MKIGILGTGMVGRTLSEHLGSLGEDVMIGTRDVESTLAQTEAPRPWMQAFPEWHRANPAVRVGTFADTAVHGEVVINATAGAVSLDVLREAGEENLAGKILLELSNPLDASSGMPPSLTVANTDSIAEQIQRAFPATKVVKTLNTVNASVMVDPGALNHGDHDIFMSGDDPDSKAEVARLLGEWFGWAPEHVIDLGDITTARGPEMYLALWLRLMSSRGTATFNVKVVG